MTSGGEGAAVSGPWAPPCTGSQLFWASWDSPTWMKVTQSVRLGSYGDWLVSTLREQCLRTSKTIDSETLTAPHLDVWHPCIFWILPGLRLGRPGQALAYAPSRSHGGGCFGTVLDALASVCLVGGCLLPGCCGGPPRPCPLPLDPLGRCRGRPCAQSPCRMGRSQAAPKPHSCPAAAPAQAPPPAAGGGACPRRADVSRTAAAAPWPPEQDPRRCRSLSGAERSPPGGGRRRQVGQTYGLVGG